MNQVLFNIQRAFGATRHEINALEKVIQEVSLEKNDFLLKEGEVCKTIALIESGSMRLFYNSHGKESCNDFFFENSVVLSFASFLSQLPSRVNIAAIEPCKLLIIQYADIFNLIRKYTHLKHFAELVLNEHLVKTEKREASLLSDAPIDRFKKLMEEHPKIFKRIPLHYVASYLSISPETLSRYRTKFLI